VFVAEPSGQNLRDTLFLFHPDGSRQLILNGSELIQAGLFPAAGGVSFGVAASAPNRIWLLAEPSEGDSPQRLFQLVDPNRDGDWSDHELRLITSPDSLPFAKQWLRTSWNSLPEWRWQLVAEPSSPYRDRSRSVLAAALSHDSGELRIYRIGDFNNDGDTLDPGETRLLFDRPHGLAGQYPVDPSGVPPQIVPLLTNNTAGARTEIAVAGLTSSQRVALISDSGTVKEIGTDFPNNTDWPANGLSLATDPSGRVLYAIVANRSESGLTWTVYRVDPTEQQ
jgi:hypothetical protein